MLHARVIALTLVVLSGGACGAAGGGGGGEGTSPDASAAEAGAGGPSVNGGVVSGTVAFERLAFLEDPRGPRVLFGGVDPAQELVSIRVELLDADGKLATIDPGGVLEPSVFEIAEASLERTGAAFFYEVRGSPGLERFVRKVAATPRTHGGRVGERREARLSPIPLRAPGQSCDPRGFDTCGVGFSCVASGGAGESRCEDVVAARRRRCLDAPRVEIGGRVRSSAAGASLWDPPDGCASSDRRNRPEGVAILHVAAPTSQLALSTTSPATDFDTVITVWGSCDAATGPLACNDDDPAPTSRVVLGSIAPGDYVVVVDSLDRRGGDFELTVTAR